VAQWGVWRVFRAAKVTGGPTGHYAGKYRKINRLKQSEHEKVTFGGIIIQNYENKTSNNII
jgi:hypothetical protein